MQRLTSAAAPTLMQLSLLEPQNYSVSVCGWPNVSGGLSCGPWPHLQKPQAGAVSLPVEGVVAPEVPGSKKKKINLLSPAGIQTTTGLAALCYAHCAAFGSNLRGDASYIMSYTLSVE